MRHLQHPDAAHRAGVGANRGYVSRADRRVTRLGGSFFLTYHRYASAAQVEDCYPRFREFLAQKKIHDPDELFVSDWYLHYRDVLSTYLPTLGS